jgi:hypothetical protein
MCCILVNIQHRKNMSIVIGPGIVIGAGIVVGIGDGPPPQPIALLITEAGLDLQTEVGDDLTTE